MWKHLMQNLIKCFLLASRMVNCHLKHDCYAKKNSNVLEKHDVNLVFKLAKVFFWFFLSFGLMRKIEKIVMRVSYFLLQLLTSVTQ